MTGGHTSGAGGSVGAGGTGGTIMAYATGNVNGGKISASSEKGAGGASTFVSGSKITLDANVPNGVTVKADGHETYTLSTVSGSNRTLVNVPVQPPASDQAYFLGYYTTSASSGGTKIFNPDGTLTANTTLSSGQVTVYGRWQKKSGVTLNGHEIANPSGIDVSGASYEASSGKLTLSGGASYTLMGNAFSGVLRQISVKNTVNLTLNELDWSVSDALNLIVIEKDAVANVTLTGANAVRSTAGCSSFQVVSGGTLNIDGPGSLNGKRGAGGKGHGVYVNGGSVSWQDATLADFAAHDHGGGVFVGSGSFTLWSGTITNCTAVQHAGGVYVSGGTFTMSGGRVTGNAAGKHGGGVGLQGGTFDLTGGTISGNGATDSGGGLAVAAWAVANLTGGEIVRNTAGNDGGGVGSKGRVTLSGSARIAENEAKGGRGGGVSLWGGTFAMAAGTIENNMSNLSGGGLRVSTSATATVSGGNLANNRSQNDIGGAAIADFGGNLTISGGAITGNRCGTGREGSAVASWGRSGGAYALVTITGGVFTGNPDKALKSGDGGGMSLQGGVYDFEPSYIAAAYAKDCGCVRMDWHSPERWTVGCGLVKDVSGFTSGTLTYDPRLACYADEGVRTGDGTVVSDNPDKKSWQFIQSDHGHCVCGSTACSGEGHDQKYWVPWSSATTLPDRPGHWYLENDVTLSAEWYPTNIALCLNGHSVTRNGRVANLASDRLIFTDCNTTPGKVSGANADGACVRVQPNASCTLARATLTGTASGLGGAVFVEADGTFDMWSGAISGSSAKNGGGGVAAASGSTVTIRGGTIRDCSAQYGGGIRSQGTVSIRGGEICNNKSGSNGNGIQMHDGRLVMTGGSIYGNSDKNTGSYGGGGIHLYGKVTATISGGSITNNSTAMNGGGIRFEGTSLAIGGTALIANNTASDGGGVAVVAGKLTMSDGTISGNTVSRFVTLSEYGGGGISVLKSAVAEISGGSIADNRSVGGGGGVVVYGGGGASLTISGGTFSGNTGGSGCDAVDVYDSGSTVEISGGTFSNNLNAAGGVLCACAKATMTVSGGVFEGNVVKDNLVRTNGGTATVRGGLFDTNAVGCVPSGYSAQALTYTQDPMWYMIASNATLVCIDEGLTNGVTSGTFATDPLRPLYTERGFKIANGHSLSLSEDGTFRIDVASHFHNICCDPACPDHATHGWTDVGVLPDLPGFFCLTNDIVLTEEWCPENGTFLCLNGHSISNPNGRAIRIRDGVVAAVTDCSTDKVGTISGRNADGACVRIETNAVFELARATLTGTGADRGGAVCVGDGGAFDMHSGTIEGCTAYAGGGVWAEGLLRISGGSVTNNTATGGGGGVCFAGRTFDLSGTARIAGNASGGHGGGVVIESGTLTMSGGMISGNAASGWGGGLCADSIGQATVVGGVIADNSSDGGGGVAARGGGVVTVSGGTVANNRSSVRSGALGVWDAGSVGTVTGGTFSNNVSAVCNALIAGDGGALIVLGGVFEGNSGIGEIVQTEEGAATVAGGLFDTNAIGCVASGFASTNVVTRPGAAYETMYVVASNGTVGAEYGYLYGGTYAFNPDGEEYAAAGVEVAVGVAIATDAAAHPVLYTLSHSDSLVVNGGFENGRTLPPVDGKNGLTDADVHYWKGTDGATVFGRNYADWKDSLGVYSNDYALCLAPGASAWQTFTVRSAGTYVLTLRVSGLAGSQLELEIGALHRYTLDFSNVRFGLVRCVMNLPAGSTVLRLTGAGALVAVDAVLLLAAEEDVDDESLRYRITNGSFENGAPLPDADRTYALATGSTAALGWTAVAAGAVVYGARAPDYSAYGVTDGEYALSLGAGAAVAQDLEVTLLEAAGYELFSTGRWYEVSFDCAFKGSSAADSGAALQLLMNGTAAVTVRPPTNGTWTATDTLVFIPEGKNVLTITNLSPSAGTVLVDNLSCQAYLHLPGEHLYNNFFAFGANLPAYGAYDYVAPDGDVELACWTCEGPVGVFERHCTAMTHAGAQSGDHALFAEDGGRIEQSFHVSKAGEYRLTFAIAARAAANDSSYWPSVVTFVDDVPVATNRATSSTAYDVCAVRLPLLPGRHDVAFGVSAPLRQALVMDKVHLRLPDELSLDIDITGVRPSFRIIPDAASAELLALGADLVAEDATDGDFTFDDFTVLGGLDVFRLESAPRAYAHPTFRCEEPVIGSDGFTIAFAGIVTGTSDGPVASCGLEDAANAACHVFALSVSDAGGSVSILDYPVASAGGFSATNVLGKVVTTNAVARGSVGVYVFTLKDGEVSFYVNGQRCVRMTSPLPETFEFDGVRLGALPESCDTPDLPRRQSPSFALADMRVYDCGLDEGAVQVLSHALAGDRVTVTAYDPVSKTELREKACTVGGVYGDIASYRPVRRGARFAGWTLSPDGSGEKVTAATQVSVANDHRLYANWSNISYTVTYDFRGYPQATNTTQMIEAGMLYAPPKGFEHPDVPFHGWTNGAALFVTEATVFPSTGGYADETIGADYDPVYADVTFDPHNGVLPDTVKDVAIGTKIVDVAPQNEPSRAAYSFDGWWSAETGGDPLTDGSLLLSALGETWHAHWLGNPQTSQWACAGCSIAHYETVSRTGEPFTLPEGADGQWAIPVSTNADVIFRAWARWADAFAETGAVEVASYDWKTGTWTVDGSALTDEGGASFFATWWTACPLDPNGGSVTPGKTYLRSGAEYGAWMDLPDAGQDGRSFAGWHTNSTAGAQVFNSTIVGEILPTNLVATWTAKAVEVVLDPNGGTNTRGNTYIAYCGEPYGDIPAPTYPGYALAAWHNGYDGGAVVTPDTICTAVDPHKLVASWTNAWYGVRYVYGLKHFAAHDFTQRNGNPWPDLFAPTAEDLELGAGQEFRGWILAGTTNFVRAGETATLLSATNLEAYVAGVVCTIRLNANDGWLLDAKDTLEVEFGTSVPELPEPKRDGCSFEGWFTKPTGGTRIEAGDPWTTPGSTELFAHWVGANEFKLIFFFGTFYGTDHVNACYNRDMPAPPPLPERTDGAVFDGWWLGDTQVYDANGQPVGNKLCPYTAECTLTARWRARQDAFAEALALTNGADYVLLDLAGTDEPGEPEHDGEGALRATHWYAFEGTNGATVRIEFTDLSLYDPAAALALYRGTSLADLVSVTQVVTFADEVLTLEATIPEDGTYYLAVAQDQEWAALTAYELTATGLAPVWKSQWTDPAMMSGATPQLRNAQALKHDGFSDDVAVRVSPTNTYAQFTAWAGVGREGKEIPPDAINTQPNVILASAYALYSTPSGEVRIVSCEATTNAAGAVSMKLTLRAFGDFTAGGASSIPLLKAAIGVIGSTTVGGAYSADDFDCKVRAVDLDLNEVRLLVTPKPTGSAAPTRFFFKGVTY